MINKKAPPPHFKKAGQVGWSAELDNMLWDAVRKHKGDYVHGNVAEGFWPQVWSSFTTAASDLLGPVTPTLPSVTARVTHLIKSRGAPFDHYRVLARGPRKAKPNKTADMGGLPPPSSEMVAIVQLDQLVSRLEAAIDQVTRLSLGATGEELSIMPVETPSKAAVKQSWRYKQTKLDYVVTKVEPKDDLVTLVADGGAQVRVVPTKILFRDFTYLGNTIGTRGTVNA